MYKITWKKCFFIGFSLVALLVCSGNLAQAAEGTADVPGLKRYATAHSKNPYPPDRLGGKIRIRIKKDNTATRFVLPGPRRLDPAVFGTPKQPSGLQPGIFPIGPGVPLNLRLTSDDDSEYTITRKATPFSDWQEAGVGTFSLDVTDQTAGDGVKTKDRVQFEAKFQTPDGTSLRVVVKKPLHMGMDHPFFGGVVTDHLLHGVTGLGTGLMPTEYALVAFWAMGDIYRGKELVNENQIIHVMITENVRAHPYTLVFDSDVGEGPGLVMHLMIPPYRATPKGPQQQPLRTGFVPFPFVKRHMMNAKKAMMGMPEGMKMKKQKVMMQMKEVMDNTKEHVMKAMQTGKMDGQPFVHVMFGMDKSDMVIEK